MAFDTSTKLYDCCSQDQTSTTKHSSCCDGFGHLPHPNTYVYPSTPTIIHLYKADISRAYSEPSDGNARAACTTLVLVISCQSATQFELTGFPRLRRHRSSSTHVTVVAGDEA
ncbi:hypothetical protein BaRGS_00018929, partial [Batillaria attramentaria]